MDDDIREFGDQLGRRAIARDWNGVHTLLAPWLRSAVSVDEVRNFFEDEYREVLSANDIEDMHYPEHSEPQVGGNGFTNATELRKPISFAGGKQRPIAAEMTDANFRYWMHLELPCSDEQMDTLGFDSFCDIWLAVAQTPEGLRVGYWSHGAY